MARRIELLLAGVASATVAGCTTASSPVSITPETISTQVQIAPKLTFEGSIVSGTLEVRNESSERIWVAAAGWQGALTDPTTADSVVLPRIFYLPPDDEAAAQPVQVELEALPSGETRPEPLLVRWPLDAYVDARTGQSVALPATQKRLRICIGYLTESDLRPDTRAQIPENSGDFTEPITLQLSLKEAASKQRLACSEQVPAE